MLSRLGRRVAEAIARRVRQDDLFEQPGERARQAPLPTTARQEPTDAGPAGPGAGSPAAGPEHEVEGKTASCTPADLPGIAAALGPGRGLRLVNHWATWCDPCVDELPALVALSEDYADKLAVLGVSWDPFDAVGAPAEVAEGVERFAARHGLRWPSLMVVADPDDFFAALSLEWDRIPQTWLVDDGGEVITRVHGVLEGDQLAALRRRIDAVLESSP